MNRSMNAAPSQSLGGNRVGGRESLVFQTLGFGVVLLLASLLLTGYHVYYNNHAHQFPMVYRLVDPALFPNDPFADSLAHHPSLLWRLIAWTGQGVSLEAILLALFIVERVLLFVAVGSLAAAFVPRSPLAVVAAWAFISLSPAPFFGEGTIMRDYVEQTGLAIPCYLLAIAAFHRHRPLRAAVWFGIGFCLTSLYGIFALSYLLAAFAADSNYRRRWKSWGAAAAVALVVSLPSLVVTLATASQAQGDPSLWVAVGRVFFPYHIFPSSVFADQFFRYFLLWGVFVLVVFVHRRRFPKLFLHGAAWSLVSLGWLVFAFLAEHLEWVPLLLLQMLRASDLWIVLASVGLIGVLATEIDPSRPGARYLYSIALLAGILFWRLQILSVYVLLAGAVLSGLNLGSFFQRWERTGNFSRTLYDRPPAEVMEFAVWAERETALEAVFLVNPVEDRLRSVLKRSIFVTFKDAGCVFWDQEYLADFTERLQALGLDVRDERLAVYWEIPIEVMNQTYANLSDPNIRLIREQYRIDYWVVEPDRPSEYPEVHRNSYFKVLDVSMPR